MELPPRARRIQWLGVRLHVPIGTTSACAENTTWPYRTSQRTWNYLRVRGEYRSILRLHHGSVELPPRARRILPDRHTPIWGLGTTSACAENTTLLVKYVAPPWNYLRVRGEYPRPVVTPPFIWELPPRARRIHHHRPQRRAFHGTTSACAENTWDHAEAQPINRNYLRVRGEYLGFMGAGPPFLELPPRARRIHRAVHDQNSTRGTTSACAENTPKVLGQQK